jgi:glutamate dehydrogenase
LSAYFPTPIREQLSQEIRDHRLAREIVAARTADDLINHVGPGLIYQLDERLGVKTPDVARAYAVVRAVFDIDELWEDTEQHTSISSVERWNLLHSLQHFIEHTASWILRRRPAPLNVEAEIARYRPGVRELMASHPRPTTIAETTERLQFLGEVFDLIETARRSGFPLETVAAIHTRSDSELGLTWLTGRLDMHATANWWDAMATATVREDLAERHHELVAAILDLDSGSEDRFSLWQNRTADAISRFSHMIAELRRDGVVDVSRACTASAELKLLARSTGANRAEDAAA